MSEVKFGSEEKIQIRTAPLLPERIEKPDRQAAIPKLTALKGRNLLGGKSVLPGRGKKEIFVCPVDFGQLEEEVSEIRPYARFMPQERAKVKPEPHKQIFMSNPAESQLDDSPCLFGRRVLSSSRKGIR